MIPGTGHTRSASIDQRSQRYFKQRIAARHKHALARLRHDRMATGKGAKRRQHHLRARPSGNRAAVTASALSAPGTPDAHGQPAHSRTPARPDGGRTQTAHTYGSSTISMPSAAGGSPAWTSWLPRTSVSAAPDAARASASMAASVAAACAAFACKKSPRNMICRAGCRASSASSAARLAEWYRAAPARPARGTRPPCRNGCRPRPAWLRAASTALSAAAAAPLPGQGHGSASACVAGRSW
jgi:hypothetical protein